MKCVLKESLPKEHSKSNEPRYNMFVNCPVMAGRQICFWCCLHICDIGEPLKRGDAGLSHPTYEAFVPQQTGRNWDSIWQTCSICSKT